MMILGGACDGNRNSARSSTRQHCILAVFTTAAAEELPPAQDHRKVFTDANHTAVLVQAWEVLVATLIRQAVKTWGMLLVLACIAVPAGVFSQPEFDRAQSEAQRQAVERILEIQSRDGPNSADLIEPMTTLGLLYRAEGDHALAAALFTQAGGIARVNYGLNSIEEALSLRHLVAAQEALGDVEAAWTSERELIALANQHLDDMRVSPVFLEIAEKRFDMLEEYRQGGFPPQIVLGCYYDGGPDRDVMMQEFKRARSGRIAGICTAGSSGRARGAITADAISLMRRAAQPYIRNALYTSAELREIEEEIFSRGGGADALIRLFDYEIRSSAPTLDQVNALVRMADYQLGRSAGAGRSEDESIFALYADAHRVLVENDVDQATIDKMFSPSIPIMLTTAGPDPLASEETPESTGHIDIAFEITKFGRSKSVDVLDTTSNAARAQKRDLIHLIKRHRFRPRVINGEFADSAAVVVRYYLNDQAQ